MTNPKLQTPNPKPLKPMNDIYNNLAQALGRVAQLSPEKQQLIELWIAQERLSNFQGNVVSKYYNALAARGGWLDQDGEVQYDETFLTFGPFPEILPGFSWILAGAYPEKYQQYLPLVLESQREMREVLFSHVNFDRCHKVLDFGCGYGSDLIALAQKYPHLELNGYTIAQEQAQVGTKKIVAHGLEDRVKIFNRNSALDAFPDRYDVFFGFEVAHHIKNKQDLFSNIGDHLNDNGYVVLADFISHQAFTIEHEDTSSYFITPEEWVEQLSSQHLQIVECIDISQEIANFLHDPDFETHLAQIDSINQNADTQAAFRSYNGLGKLLRQGMASYVLMTAQKHEHLSIEDIARSNQQALKELTPYCQKSVKQGLYQLEWQRGDFEATTAATAPGNWLIFADRRGVAEDLAQQLEAQGDRYVLVSPGQAYIQLGSGRYQIDPSSPADFQRLLRDITVKPSGVIHLWSLDTAEDDLTLDAVQNAQVTSCGSVLHLVQALTQAGQSPRVYLATRGSVSVGTESVQVQQAPLWGLGRVIALEHPELQCTRVDLEAGTEVRHLLQTLQTIDREDQIAWRQGVRYVPRLVRHIQTPVESTIVRDECSYLITGGLGALGLQVAQGLVEQGARHLVLTGRSGASETAKSAIAQLEKMGTQVLVVPADVSNPADVAQLIQTIQTSLPPLAGVIHAAGVLDDGVLTQLSWDRFRRVMAAKVDGAWNLHQQTRDLPLDLFVCFSSISSVLGNAGQGNYAAANAFLDALAHHRRALGLPSLTVNWGPWAEVGMAANLSRQARDRMAAEGLGTISPKQGLQVLATLLGQGATQVSAVPLNWAKFIRKFPTDAYPVVLSELVAALPQSETSASMPVLSPQQLKQQVQLGTVEERQKLGVAYLQNLIGQFLGLPTGESPEPDRALAELGLDSLVSIQVRNRIKTELQVDVPMGEFLGNTNIDRLSRALLEQLTFANLVLSEVPDADLSEEMEEITL
jgi:NAD(P)-dependent dehydrogenase (short-subunit alcohol dehydrogenase family)/cyclopropane fatty-acyl-phospholipid synthase-like methyltransferase